MARKRWAALILTVPSVKFLCRDPLQTGDHPRAWLEPLRVFGIVLASSWVLPQARVDTKGPPAGARGTARAQTEKRSWEEINALNGLSSQKKRQ